MMDVFKNEKYWWFFVLIGLSCWLLPFLMIKYFGAMFNVSDKFDALVWVITPPFGLLMLIIGLRKAYLSWSGWK